MNLGKTNFFLLFSLGKANLKNYKNRSPMKKISCNNNVNNRKAKRDIREPKKIKSDSKQWGSVKLVSWKCKEMYLDFIWDLLKI